MKTTNVKTRFIASLISTIKRGLLQGMAIAIGFFGTTILAVAISGTIKTWTTGEVLKSSDLNTTISSLKTAIEGITSSQWLTGSNNIYYTGNVGIGITNSLYNMEIKATADLPLGIRNSANTLQYSLAVSTIDGSQMSYYDQTGTQRVRISSSSNAASFFNNAAGVGIGVVTPTQLLTVNGNTGNTTGVWVNNSDERLKKNIQPLGIFLEKLTELRPVTFEWKDPKKLNAKEGKHIGFIAQEVEKVFPYWVDTDKSGMKWLSMEGVNAAFVQSFKEVAFRLRSGNDRISAVAQKIESLEKEKAANDKKVFALEEENKRLRTLLEKQDRLSLKIEERLSAIENMQMARK